jgi:hypothetical protein
VLVKVKCSLSRLQDVYYVDGFHYGIQDSVSEICLRVIDSETNKSIITVCIFFSIHVRR